MSAAPDPARLLDETLVRVERELVAGTWSAAVTDADLAGRIAYVCSYANNRAGVRLLMACMLAKTDRPTVDPRQPYSEIGGDRCFSGRAAYDEPYVGPFVTRHRLPCNETTAFLTPALRNINRPLDSSLPPLGRPARLYHDCLTVLDAVAEDRVHTVDVLGDIIAHLVRMRDGNRKRLADLVAEMRTAGEPLPLSVDATVTLIRQHLACPYSSRLPVLLVAAAYRCAAENLGRDWRIIHGHNAADRQTGALADLEILMVGHDRVTTAYEMKRRTVTVADLDAAVTKIAHATERIENYVFVTTEAIGQDVADYAAGMYDHLGGVEIAVLDCVGFLRHFLHLFHWLRTDFLDTYQGLLLAEPDSGVRQSLKEAFLSLRRAAEWTE